MSDSLQMLLLNGFMIYPSNGKFIVRKESVPESCYVLESQEFNTYTEAIDYAILILKQPRKQIWGVLMRYNRGLGIEYKNLSDVFAATKDEALKIANEEVEVMAKKVKLLSFEVKVSVKK